MGRWSPSTARGPRVIIFLDDPEPAGEDPARIPRQARFLIEALARMSAAFPWRIGAARRLRETSKNAPARSGGGNRRGSGVFQSREQPALPCPGARGPGGSGAGMPASRGDEMKKPTDSLDPNEIARAATALGGSRGASGRI